MLTFELFHFFIFIYSVVELPLVEVFPFVTRSWSRTCSALVNLTNSLFFIFHWPSKASTLFIYFTSSEKILELAWALHLPQGSRIIHGPVASPISLCNCLIKASSRCIIHICNGMVHFLLGHHLFRFFANLWHVWRQERVGIFSKLLFLVFYS